MAGSRLGFFGSQPESSSSAPEWSGLRQPSEFTPYTSFVYNVYMMRPPGGDSENQGNTMMQARMSASDQAKLAELMNRPGILGEIAELFLEATDVEAPDPGCLLTLEELGVDSLSVLNFERLLSDHLGVEVGGLSLHLPAAEMYRFFDGLREGLRANGDSRDDHALPARTGPGLVSLRSFSNPDARLVCFPYAGGSSEVFMHFARALDPGVDLLGLELPGRRAALSPEDPATFAALRDRICDQLLDLSEVPLVLYGHSMGGLLAFDVATEVHQRTGGAIAPRLVVSGVRAPHLPYADWLVKPLHLRDAASLYRELQRLGIIPREVLDSESTRDALLPRLRNDFRLLHTRRSRPIRQLALPCHVLRAESDPLVSERDVVGTGLLHRGFSLHFEHVRHTVVPGDHFFLHQHPQVLTQVLKEELGRCVPACQHFGMP